MLKQIPLHFSFQLSSEKPLSKILPILSKLVGKAPLVYRSDGVMEITALLYATK
jgi:hypothetical protein